MLPNGWRRVHLENVSNKIMVGIASAATHAYRASGIPMLRNQNIKESGIDDSDLLYIDEEYEKAHRNKRLIPGDVLTVRTGYPGLSAVVDERFRDAQCFTSLITRPNSHQIRSDFLCYYINSPLGIRFFSSSEAGGAQKNVNAGVLKRLPLLLPPLPEQQKIAAIISTWDRAIELTEKLIATKQKRKQALMQQLLTGNVRIGSQNSSWTQTTLKDVTVSNAFGPRFSSDLYSQDGNIGSIRTTDLDEEGNIDYSTVPYATLPIEKVRSHILNTGDLLITRSGTCGVPCVFEEQAKPIVAGAFLIRFQLTDDVNPHFLFGLLKTPQLQSQINAMASGGVQKNLTGTNLLKLRFNLPPIQEQEAIVKVIAATDAEIRLLNNRREFLFRQKKGLMQQLLTGKLRVNVDAETVKG